MQNKLTGFIGLSTCQTVVLMIAVDLILRSSAEDTDIETPEQIPCPDAWDPRPCACYNASSVLSLVCKGIESTEQLVAIFDSLHKPTTFSEFRMENSTMTSLPNGLFGKASFAAIQIHGTTLETIDNGAFKGLENTLRALALWQNQVNRIDFDSFRGLKRFNILHISSENIISIPDNAFANLHLTNIDLVANKIEVIGNGAFANLSNVKEIVICQNNIKKIGNFAFSNPTAKKLRKFLFSSNNMTQKALSENSFRGLNTTDINLQDNKLEYLPQEVFETLIQTISEKPDGTILGFGNPIKCDQRMKWLVDKPLKFKKPLIGFQCPNKKCIREMTEEDLTL